MSKYSKIVGIDVSKRTLDVCLKRGNEYSFYKLKNNESGLPNEEGHTRDLVSLATFPNRRI